MARLNLLSGGLDFCTPNNKSWTPIEAIELETEKTLEFRDIEIFDGKLYAATHRALEFLMVFDIQLDANGGVPTYTATQLKGWLCNTLVVVGECLTIGFTFGLGTW